jgi:predicted phosphoribosyltransferase
MSIKPELVRPGLFRDRHEARRLLAGKVARYANRPDVIVLALPRGGVPVACEVASVLALTEDSQIVETVRVCADEDAGMHLAVS